MKTKTLNIIEIDNDADAHTEAKTYLAEMGENGFTYIHGVDMVVSPRKRAEVRHQFGTKDTMSRVSSDGNPMNTKPRAGDIVIAEINNYTEGFYNGDLGLVVEGDGGLEVELKDDLKVRLTSDFAVAPALTYHQLQGQRFRNVIAVADEGLDERYLKAAAKATQGKLTLIGTEAELTSLLGPNTPEGDFDFGEIARRVFEGNIVTWKIQVNGEDVGSVMDPADLPPVGQSFRQPL